MIENINVKRCTCDVCKKVFDVDSEAGSPLYELVLPMDYISETGEFIRVITYSVEVCDKCLLAMRDDIAKYYNAKCVRFGGLKISRREDGEHDLG